MRRPSPTRSCSSGRAFRPRRRWRSRGTRCWRPMPAGGRRAFRMRERSLDHTDWAMSPIAIVPSAILAEVTASSASLAVVISPSETVAVPGGPLRTGWTRRSPPAAPCGPCGPAGPVGALGLGELEACLAVLSAFFAVLSAFFAVLVELALLVADGTRHQAHGLADEAVRGSADGGQRDRQGQRHDQRTVLRNHVTCRPSCRPICRLRRPFPGISEQVPPPPRPALYRQQDVKAL